MIYAYSAAIVLLSAILFFVIIPRIVRTSKKKAPFVRTRGGAVPEILKLLQLNDRSVLYDLGCGDGRILRAAAARTKGLTGVGIENDWLPIIFSHLRRRPAGMKIIKGDIFKAPLDGATHIYCYLFPQVMIDLEPVVLAKCRPGTRIVSCDFPFPNLTPAQTVQLPGNRCMLARALYLYVL